MRHLRRWKYDRVERDHTLLRERSPQPELDKQIDLASIPYEDVGSPGAVVAEPVPQRYILIIV